MASARNEAVFATATNSRLRRPNHGITTAAATRRAIHVEFTYTAANGHNLSSKFVADDLRILDLAPVAVNPVNVRMTNSTVVNLDGDVTWAESSTLEVPRQKGRVSLRALRLLQALQIGGESLSSNCRVTVSFPSFAMESWPLNVGVSHLATSIVTFTEPGTLNASAPASILPIGMMPGDGIDSPSCR